MYFASVVQGVSEMHSEPYLTYSERASQLDNAAMCHEIRSQPKNPPVKAGFLRHIRLSTLIGVKVARIELVYLR